MSGWTIRPTYSISIPIEVSLTLANHTSGQVTDKFATSTPVTDILYQFRLYRQNTVTVDNLRVNYTTGTVADGDVTGGGALG